MRPIGIGIVGGGYMGKAHAVAMLAVGAVFGTTLRPRLEMVCATTDTSAEGYAQAYGFARATADWRVLVDDPAVEAVVIAAPQEMHRVIAEAAFALPAGQMSATPVRSPFGWHIIRVDERRASAPPSFEEAREALRQRLFEGEINALVENARASAKIERFNLDGSTPRAIDAAEPPAPAAPAGRPAAPTRR